MPEHGGIAIPDEIAAFNDEIVAIRRDLHQHPELGFEEVRTAGIVAERLAGWGVEVHRGVGRTGVVGVLRAGSGGNRSIGLRADMDALPMHEESGLPFASRSPGRFHGCGHDGHTAILLAAARYLATTRRFDGTVVFVFQPAEEGLGGARAMIDDGLFARFPVDEIYGLHNSPLTPHGHVHVSPGPVQAGADFFDIVIRGSGGHAAHPHMARDPIVASAALIAALQGIVSRHTPPREAAVLSVTAINSNVTYNVIPETVHLRGTVRTLDGALKRRIADRIRAVAAGVALSHDVSIEADIRDAVAPLANVAEQADAIAAIARTVVGEANVSTDWRPSMGSEDFSEYLNHVPGAFFSLGHHGDIPLHSPRFVLDDGILPVGATLFARLVEGRLSPEA
ncbi:MAG: M20 aminoacylase family protein [Pseudochelatococcus sp.]|jgi:amidohydrolase|uniref:M20 aminoacylase family protein n=1 Tax=Pseudochelatococcus sp. TaxID=2020869 RepID=UPI003D8A00FA